MAFSSCSIQTNERPMALDVMPSIYPPRFPTCRANSPLSDPLLFQLGSALLPRASTTFQRLSVRHKRIPIRVVSSFGQLGTRFTVEHNGKQRLCLRFGPWQSQPSLLHMPEALQRKLVVVDVYSQTFPLRR